jgi:hypothetical protein
MNLHLFTNPFLQQILSATALLVISFPNNLPTTGGRHPKMKAFAFSSVVLISIGLISACLSTLMPVRLVDGGSETEGFMYVGGGGMRDREYMKKIV